jgi:hypothetical protein
MRKLSIAIAAVVAAGCLASAATAAPDPIKTLNRKVAALQNQVKTLRADLNEAQDTLDCLGPLLPMAQFGGVFNGVPEGYVYGIGSPPQLGLTTGLDLVNPSGQTPGEDYAPVMTWAPSCAGDPPSALRVQLRSRPAASAGRVIARLAW